MGHGFEKIERFNRTGSSHHGHFIPINRPWPGRTRYTRHGPFQRLELRPGHCRVYLGTSDTKVLLLENLRRRVILGYADPATLQNHQHGNQTTTNGHNTREIVFDYRTGPDDEGGPRPAARCDPFRISACHSQSGPAELGLGRHCACWDVDISAVPFHKAMDRVTGNVVIDGDTQSVLQHMGMESTGTHGACDDEIIWHGMIELNLRDTYN